MTQSERSFSQNIFKRFAQLRIVAGTLCLALGLQLISPNLISDFQAAVLVVAGTIAAFSALLQLTLLHHQRHRGLVTAYAFILLDCAVYGALTALGTITKGYGAFLVLPVLAGALTLRGVHAYIAPAIISIGILIYSGKQTLVGLLDFEQLSRNAGLGAVLFFVALVSHLAARRVASAESRAKNAEVDTENLEKINQKVIQQLPQGLLCVDQYGRIRQANTLAKKALPKLKVNGYLGAYDEALAEQLRYWRYAQNYRHAEVQINNEKWHCEFQPIAKNSNITLILLDSDTSAQDREREKRLVGLGQFTAAIAHEIRNPLAAIIQAGELLQGSTTNNQTNKLTSIIATHGRRLNAIVDNILQLTRHKQIDRESFAIHAWLAQYINDFNSLNQPQNHFALTPGAKAETKVKLSKLHLEQIFDNLCNNALAYGAPPYLISTAVTATKKLQINIRDHGTGIPTNIEPKAFAPFITSSGRGTGLGLYICQELAKLNKLRLEYNAPSDTQPYCEFRVTIEHERTS